jgi:tRNA(Ile)-lysidine synthase
VALLRLLADRTDLSLHVVHLDHEWRGDESAADAEFVRQLAEKLQLPATIVRASEMNVNVEFDSNVESRGRAMRAELFQHVVKSENLAGVLLAHHADDQVETVLMRLARGGSIYTLRGMQTDVSFAGLRRVRPLLNCHRKMIVEYLQAIGQPWREDSSNASMQFTRNRARRVLRRYPFLFGATIELAKQSSELVAHCEQITKTLSEAFSMRDLIRDHTLAARWQALRWLVARGAAPEECTVATADRLIDMCRDAASPAKQHFPGGIEVVRKNGLIRASPANAAAF